MAMLAANIVPDSAKLDISQPRRFASRGALVPLDDFLAAEPNLKKSNYYPNMVRFYQTDGSQYGLPRSVAPTGLIYDNKRLF